MINGDNVWNTDDVEFFDYTYEFFGELCGKVQQLYIGHKYKVRAKANFVSKYNKWQYEPVSVTADIPKTEAQQKIFIQTFTTERQASELLREYPNIVNEVINGTDNVDLSKLNGIGKHTWKLIRDKIIENFSISDVVALLQPYGVSYKKIKRLIKYEPNPEILKDKLNENPYFMTKVKGFGFPTVDNIALNINKELIVSVNRTRAFINYYLSEIGNNEGHTWVWQSQLNSAIQNYIPECYEIYKEEIEREKEKEDYLHFDDTRVGLWKYYITEKNIFEILEELNNKDTYEVDYNETAVSLAEERQGFKYTEEQKEIIKNSLNSNIFVLAGKAGVGKSTIARGILSCYKDTGKSIALCALSAKAAQRLTETTGYNATTIHRMLGYQGDNNFLYNSKNPLPYDVVFIDEASMINQELFWDLLSAVRLGSRVIICGDEKQLPPIGVGNIFHDILLGNNNLTINKLTKVLRQAQDSGILVDANIIREAKTPIATPQTKIWHGKKQDMIYMFRDTKEDVHKLAYNTYLKEVEYVGLDNILLIVPRKKDCVNCSLSFNKELQKNILNLPDKDTERHYGNYEFVNDTKIIQRKNDSSRNIYNGEVGYITDTYLNDNKRLIGFTAKYIDPISQETKIIDYTDDEMSDVDLAYAMTVHLSQGSGYDTVIIVIDNSSYMLLDNCLLYTAITRAKKKCVLIAEPKAFKRCIINNLGERRTWSSITV